MLKRKRLKIKELDNQQRSSLKGERSETIPSGSRDQVILKQYDPSGKI